MTQVILVYRKQMSSFSKKAANPFFSFLFLQLIPYAVYAAFTACWLEFCVLWSLTCMNLAFVSMCAKLNLQTPFIGTVFVNVWWFILTLLSSLFRLRPPFPYLWGFGTFPWLSIGLWICNAHINLPLKLLHQLPHLCHLAHPRLPRARSSHPLSQSLKSCAPHIGWLWSSLLVPSLELLLKVHMFAISETYAEI